MRIRITRLDVLQTGKISAIFCGLISLIQVSIMIFDQKSFGMLPMLPVAIATGFVLGVIVAFIYNLATKYIGGLEVSIEYIDDDFPQQPQIPNDE